MHKKVIPILIAFILIGSLSDCGKYDAPISSKTYDIKTFRIEDGKKIPIDPIFSKTVFEYENEPEGEIDFVEWKPKPLTAKGELEQFLIQNINKSYAIDNERKESNFKKSCSTPDGWHISNGDDPYLFDPATGEKQKSFGSPRFFDQNTNLCVGKKDTESNNNHIFACWDRISKHLFWENNAYWPKPVVIDNSLYYHDGMMQMFINMRDLRSGKKIFVLEDKDHVRISVFFCESTRDNLWFSFTYISNAEALARYDMKHDEAYIANISGIEGGFVYDDKYFYYNNKLQIYEVDKETMEPSLYVDMSKYLPNNTPLRESILWTLDGDLLAIMNYKKHIIVNMKTKKVFEPKEKIHNCDNRIYFQDNFSIWGIDPETLERSWSIRIPSTSIMPGVLIIDERGVLDRDEINLYGFRPKK